MKIMLQNKLHEKHIFIFILHYFVSVILEGGRVFGSKGVGFKYVSHCTLQCCNSIGRFRP
uniref:Uncharacterized protein n=1 Tax=Anguilla anguilla TaxID=7936 RepID=A0A0E9WWS9_ANGAN